MTDYNSSSEVYDIAVEEYKSLTLPELNAKDDSGIPTKDRIWMLAIVNGILCGRTWGKIAEDLGVHRRALYEFRRRVELWDFVNSLMDEQLIDIASAKAKGDFETAMKYRNQILLALTPRRVRQRIEADARVEFVFTVEKPDAENPSNVQTTS